MSRLEPATLYYAMLNSNLVQLVTEKNRSDVCLVRTLSERQLECRIVKEKFALLGHCKLVLRPMLSAGSQEDMAITVLALNEWDANDAMFRAGRNGPLNTPRTI